MSQKPTVPLRFNVDCYGLTVEEYKFLLDDIEEAIAEGNRKYGYGEPGYTGADGYYYPLPDGVMLPELEPKPKRFRIKSKSKLRRRPQIHYRVKRRTKSVPSIKAVIKGFRD